MCVDFNDRFKRQGAAGIFKEDSGPLIGAVVDVMESVTDLA